MENINYSLSGPDQVTIVFDVTDRDKAERVLSNLYYQEVIKHEPYFDGLKLKSIAAYDQAREIDKFQEEVTALLNKYGRVPKDPNFN